ncbi:MAG: GAF domain-containing protein, partial [Proteobacteria bacterium]|nr:GAF domain-containing protein [Pseudomonadota bacterium]
MSIDYFETAAALFEDFSAAPLQSEEELWEYLIRKTAPAIECHAATVFEADEIKKTLTFRKSIGPVGRDLVGVSFGYQGIAGWCAENKRPILVNDTENDLRFTKKVDYGTGFKTRNIIAVPAISGGKLLGVVEFINSVRGNFSEAEVKLAAMLTAFVARDVYMRRLEATIKQLSLKGENTINNLSGGFI